MEKADPDSRPEFLTIEDDIACFRPVGDVTLDKAVDLVDDALLYCRKNGIGRLFADITGLTGFAPPSTGQRFFIIEKWVATADGKVVMSMVLRPEIIDPQKIGMTMANNRGLHSDVFTDAEEAMAWLNTQPHT